MYRGNPSSNFSVPGEYRRAAERLFPKDGFLRGQKPDIRAAGEYAKSLGIGVEYQRLLSLEKNSVELQSFLIHFQNNIDLLIKKTWVEKHEEVRKDTLQDNIPVFMETIERSDYFTAIENFSMILDELAYLFFGDQSEKDDFAEYTFRIDTQMGLFWWYGNKLELVKKINDRNIDNADKILWAVLLLGLCYLTNF